MATAPPSLALLTLFTLFARKMTSFSFLIVFVLIIAELPKMIESVRDNSFDNLDLEQLKEVHPRPHCNNNGRGLGNLSKLMRCLNDVSTL